MSRDPGLRVTGVLMTVMTWRMPRVTGIITQGTLVTGDSSASLIMFTLDTPSKCFLIDLTFAEVPCCWFAQLNKTPFIQYFAAIVKKLNGKIGDLFVFVCRYLVDV